MKMTRKRTLLVIAVFAALLVAVAWYQFGRHRVPPGQPPLATLDGSSLAAFKADFNAASGQMRIVLLLSPT
jgi:hypothetical protein